MTVKAGEKIKNPLSNKKVMVKFIDNKKHAEKPKQHMLWKGKLDGTVDKMVVAMMPNGTLRDPFTPNERAFVADATGLNPIIFDPYYKGQDSYWTDYVVIVDKEGLVLDMSNLHDFIKERVLRTNTGLVAPSLEATKNNAKASYKYYLVDEGQDIDAGSQDLEDKTKVYTSLAKISKDKAKMSYLIRQITLKTPGRNIELKTLSAQLNAIIEGNISKIAALIDDKYFEYKVLIENGVLYGAIQYNNGEYAINDPKEGIMPMALKGGKADLSAAAEFIAEPMNQKLKFLIEERIKNALE